MKQKDGAYLGVPLISRLNREGSAMDEDAAPVRVYGYIVRLWRTNKKALTWWVSPHGIEWKAPGVREEMMAVWVLRVIVMMTWSWRGCHRFGEATVALLLLYIIITSKIFYQKMILKKDTPAARDALRCVSSPFWLRVLFFRLHRILLLWWSWWWQAREV